VLPDPLAAGIRIRMERGAIEMKHAIEAAARVTGATSTGYDD
jgi:hypothetical protein